MPISSAAMQKARLGKTFAQCRQMDFTKSLVRGKREFEGRALQVIHKYFEIIRLHVSMLGERPKNSPDAARYTDRAAQRKPLAPRTKFHCGDRHVRRVAMLKQLNPHIPPSHSHRASRYQFPIPARSSPPLRGCVHHVARVQFRGARSANNRRDIRESAQLGPAAGIGLL